MEALLLAAGGAVLGALVTWLLGLPAARRQARGQERLAAQLAETRQRLTEALDTAAARDAADAGRDADRRIDEVVRQYAELVGHNKTGALHGILVAGVKNLRSSDEIRVACDRATAQTGNDPLRQYAVDAANLKAFIDAAQFDRLKVTNDTELRERFCKG